MSADLYSEHFGFSERPFSLSPDPDLLFWTKDHQRAYTILEYGFETRAPLTVVTGEVGIGKTTLIQALLLRDQENEIIGLISNAQGNRDDLLRWVLNALEIDPLGADSYVALFERFQDFVIDAYAKGKRTVLIIDEAQNLGIETLEELRMLTNINSGKHELLQLILVGQPELRSMIQLPELRQFAQRVTATYHLRPLDPATSIKYIRHRLQSVEGTGDEFDTAALEIVLQGSEGIPRIINKMCDLALVYAASAGKMVVDAEIMNELIQDGVILQTTSDPLFLTQRADLPNKAAE